MNPYYYIYRVDVSHPKTRHYTLASAHAESIRLAGQHPGDSFEILQCLGTTRTVNAQTFWMDGVIPPDVQSASTADECNQLPGEKTF